MPSTRNDPLIGKSIDDYRIEHLIAKGGMGRVYEAVDTQLDRVVAIKVITLDEEEADELMARFQREARVIGQLDVHPNIVTIYRYGKAQGVHYIAMRYVKGESLANYLNTLRENNKFMPVEEMIHILAQVAGALDYAHRHHAVHRDVKPANIMLEVDSTKATGERIAILMDFGLVLQVNTGVTTGTAFGTPRYISPEQAMSSMDATAKSDIYSLGIIAFEVLTGRTPFGSDDEETPIAVALSHVTKEPPSPREFRPELPETLDDVMRKVLAKEPADRYQTATEFVQELADVLSFERKVTEIMPTPPPEELEELAEEGIDTVRGPVEPVIPIPVPSESQVAPEKAQQGTRRRDYILPTLILLLVLVGVVVGIFMFTGVGGDGALGTSSSGNAAGDGQIELYYEEETLTIRNAVTRPLRLTGLELRREDQVFSLNDIGVSFLEDWSPGACVSVTLINTDPEIPDVCGDNIGRSALRYAQSGTFVWMNGETFEVYQDGSRLATCVVSEGVCTVSGVLRANDA